MTTAIQLDAEAIARVCRRFSVARLRLFGSATTEDFDPDSSDIDFLVDYQPDAGGTLRTHFELKNELERIVGRRVDLVVAGAVRNPYFAREAFASAEELYAA